MTKSGRQKMKRKISYTDISKYRNVLMGLQILLLIAFHFTEDCKLYDVRYDGWIYLFYKYIHSSGVDLFLMLSGLGLYFSWKKQPPAGQFFRKRFQRILIPYAIVAVPAWLWLDIFNERAGWLAFVKDISFVSFFLEEKRWFWYILMAGVCYLIFPSVFKIVEEAGNKTGEWMRVAGLCTMSTAALMLLQLYHTELYNHISIAISRFPAFFIGVWLGKAAWEKRTIAAGKAVMLAGAAIVMAWPLQLIDKKIWGVYSAAFLNLAFCLLLVGLLSYMSGPKRGCVLKKGSCFVQKVFGWFGKYTLELYLIHVAIRKVMKVLGYYTYRLSYEAVLIILSVILALVLSWMTRWIMKHIPVQH